LKIKFFRIGGKAKMQKIVKAAAAAVDIIIVLLLAAVIFLDGYLPDSYYVASGNELTVSGFGGTVQCSTQTEDVSVDNDVSRAELKLLGLIPIKTVDIRSIETPVLIPCGEPFGIKMLTDGVIVAQVSSFETESGLKSPAKESGIQAGDIITSIDGIAVSSNSEVEDIISSSLGKAVDIEFTRDGEKNETDLYPLKCSTDGKFRAGLWVRDSSAGIGTMTFYDPETGEFAGLGHPVCDVDTGELMPLSSGEVVKTAISGVKKGTAGSPGELIGGFISSFSMGALTSNTECGVFGKLDNFTATNQALPLGMRQEIKTGKAYIYTTVSGTTPKMYEISIEKIDLNDTEDHRNMIIRVTDEELLSETGGIVQGMSGSPIIQDGRLVGAVTHVFVNDPEKGYAIFADTMYEQMIQN
jgi:stage IV sporulation protein B